MVIFMDDGTRYMAHWRFEVAGDMSSASNIAKSQPNKSSFRSVCDQTMVGFVVRSGGTMEAHPVECFYAHKGEAKKADKETKSVA